MLKLLIITLLTLPSNCYQDLTPDPDFLITPTELQETGEDNKQYAQKPENSEYKIPGYFKYLCKSTAQLPHVTAAEREVLQNVDNTDPQTLTETLLAIAARGGTPESNCTVDFSVFKRLYLLDFSSRLAELTLLAPVLYLVCVFLLVFSVRRLRALLLSSHLLLLYTAAVYFKLNQQYTEIKAKKISALLDIPGHCKEQLRMSDLVSGVLSKMWSKVQIGDVCQKYHYQALSEPVYELNFMKCLVYPGVSVITVPLQVIGEELGPFLENVLSPFAVHLQIPILLFLVVLPPACIIAVRWSRDTWSRDRASEVRELAALKREVLLELRGLRGDMCAIKSNTEMCAIKSNTETVTDVTEISMICDRDISPSHSHSPVRSYRDISPSRSHGHVVCEKGGPVQRSHSGDW